MNIQPTECSRCRKPNLVFWATADEIACENCVEAQGTSLGGARNYGIRFSPQLNSSGRWSTSGQVTFGDLRKFIDESLRPHTAKELKPYLAAEAETIGALIDLLHRMVVRPEMDPIYQAAAKKMDALKSEIRTKTSEIENQIAPLKQRARELEKLMGQQPDKALREPLKKARRELMRRIDALRQALPPLQRQLAVCQATINNVLEGHPSGVQLHCIARLKNEFETWKRGGLVFTSSLTVHRVYWKLLKPSGNSWDELLRHFNYLSRTTQERYEIERLKFVHDMLPAEIYVGSESFEGYVVFIFQHVETAVLECPKVGNALYIMDTKDWKFLSQLSKTELLDHHRQEVKRIVHSRYWQYDIRKELENRKHR